VGVDYQWRDFGYSGGVYYLESLYFAVIGWFGGTGGGFQLFLRRSQTVDDQQAVKKIAGSGALVKSKDELGSSFGIVKSGFLLYSA
jgi:hypothetical protein